MKFELHSKVWLENNNGRVFGDGPCELLENIKRLGSLRKAALEMGMSYSQALNIIKMIENNLGYPVIYRQAGGAAGGGSYLTEKGNYLLERYMSFRMELDYEMGELFQKHFNHLE